MMKEDRSLSPDHAVRFVIQHTERDGVIVAFSAIASVEPQHQTRRYCILHCSSHRRKSAWFNSARRNSDSGADILHPSTELIL